MSATTTELDVSPETEQAPSNVTNLPARTLITTELHVQYESLPADFSGGRVKVMINAEEGTAGNKPVVLSVNGYVIEIQRNKLVPIPAEHYMHLLNMKQDTFDERGTKTGERHRYSFTSDGIVIPPAAKKQTKAKAA